MLPIVSDGPGAPRERGNEFAYVLRDMADPAADFVLANVRDERGRHLHRYRDGEAALQANTVWNRAASTSAPHCEILPLT